MNDQEGLISGYSPDKDRPLASYAVLTALFNAIFAGFLLSVKRTGRTLPERVALSDLLLLGVATHKLSRLITKDFVTSWYRAPFTRFSGSAGDGELEEEVRGKGMRHAIGELLTCPFCTGQWVAAFFGYGLVLTPRATRFVAGVFTMLTLSDFLHYARSVSKKEAEG